MIVLLAMVSCTGQTKKTESKKSESPKSEVTKPFPLQKSEEQWKKELTPEQYEVLRQKGTERPHTGEYVNTFDKGIYVCAACGNKLFNSDSKFHSDCGWPSFDKAIKGSVVYKDDMSFGMTRTEVMCANCGGHLGHVFDDGPQETTGDRFCTNSVSVKFIPAKK